MRRLTGFFAILALSLATFTGSVPLPVPAGLPIAEVVSLDAEPAAAIRWCRKVDQLTSPDKWWVNGHFAAWGTMTRVHAGPCRDLNIENQGGRSQDFISLYQLRSGRWVTASRQWVTVPAGQHRVTISRIRAGTNTVTGSTGRSWGMRIAT